MKVLFIILLFLPILCNELVFEVLDMDNIEIDIVDNLPEDSGEKESSENSEEEKNMEYFDVQEYSHKIFESLKIIDNYPHLSNWSICIIDISCPPPEQLYA
jgi:hypothetical protein